MTKLPKSFQTVAKAEIGRNFAHEWFDIVELEWAEEPQPWGCHDLFLLDQAIRLIFCGEWYHERLAERIQAHLERYEANHDQCTEEDRKGAVRLVRHLLSKIRNARKDAERKNRK